MSFLNLFGSESKTDQTAYNQQVGASGGSIAFGAASSGNKVVITTADPAVAEAAMEANAYVTTNVAGQAFQFAGGVTSGALGTANLGIAAANDLAGRFMLALQKNYQNSTEFASASLTAATQAEQAALAQSLNAVSALSGQVANIAAAQTPGGLSIQATNTTADTTFKIVLVAAAALVIFALLKKG
jgi:hypothetical protein